MHVPTIVALAISLLAAPAYADAIGPPPVARGCAPGAESVIVAPQTHSQFAYCAPSLCEAGAACREGARCEVVELEIEAREVAGSGGTAASYAQVAGTCDAPDDEEPIQLQHGEGLLVFFGGPLIDRVPVGCHRVRSWVRDESVHCDEEAEPAHEEPPPEEPVVAPPPTPALEPEAPPPSTCACAAAQHSRAPLVLVLVLVLATAVARRRSREECR